ncbi:unnamed protein product [Ectocarpus sp. 12 AP-2014]
MGALVLVPKGGLVISASRKSTFGAPVSWGAALADTYSLFFSRREKNDRAPRSAAHYNIVIAANPSWIMTMYVPVPRWMGYTYSMQSTLLTFTHSGSGGPGLATTKPRRTDAPR